MAEPLKTFFSPALVRRLAADVAAASPDFRSRAFIKDATSGLDQLELLDRGKLIATSLSKHLPPAYPEAIDILLRSLGPEHATDELVGVGMAPFFYLPHVLFVAERGLEHFDLSMRAQYELTKRFSAERSIRPYIAKDPDRTFALLREWARDSNAHVRRLVSEGTRLRLPWAMRVDWLDRNPRRVLELLELLQDDPTTLVRRSVANNLNDLGKVHPKLLFAICGRHSHRAARGLRISLTRADGSWAARVRRRASSASRFPGAMALRSGASSPRDEDSASGPGSGGSEAPGCAASSSEVCVSEIWASAGRSRSSACGECSGSGVKSCGLPVLRAFARAVAFALSLAAARAFATASSWSAADTLGPGDGVAALRAAAMGESSEGVDCGGGALPAATFAPRDEWGARASRSRAARSTKAFDFGSRRVKRRTRPGWLLNAFSLCARTRPSPRKTALPDASAISKRRMTPEGRGWAPTRTTLVLPNVSSSPSSSSSSVLYGRMIRMATGGREFSATAAS